MPTRQQVGFPFPGSTIDVVAVVASANGVDAIGRVLAALPFDFPAAVVVVEHLLAGYMSRLPELLTSRTALRVSIARAGEVLTPRHVYLAPPGRQMTVTRPGIVDLLPPARRVRSAGDPLFASLAQACGPRAAAVVLTGTGANGAAGVRHVRAAGGLVVAQDPETAPNPDMPRAALATGCVDYALPVDQIGPLLDWAARADHRDRRPARQTVNHS